LALKSPPQISQPHATFQIPDAAPLNYHSNPKTQGGKFHRWYASNSAATTVAGYWQIAFSQGSTRAKALADLRYDIRHHFVRITLPETAQLFASHSSSPTLSLTSSWCTPAARLYYLFQNQLRRPCIRSTPAPAKRHVLIPSNRSRVRRPKTHTTTASSATPDVFHPGTACTHPSHEAEQSQTTRQLQTRIQTCLTSTTPFQ
jgi:hypothetical protein